MSIGSAMLLDVVLHPRVQDLAVKAFDGVYSRIFKESEPSETALLGERTAVMSPAEAALNDRLTDIELRLSRLPSDHEMAQAFSAMQAQIRQGQQRTLLVLTVLGFFNAGLIVALIFAVRY